MTEIDTNRSADEWEQYLENNPDEVLMLVDSESAIHTFEWDTEVDELMFRVGGSRGYDYKGSRAELESFSKQDSEAHKLVPRGEEYPERKRLASGEYETVQEWVQDHESG